MGSRENLSAAETNFTLEQQNLTLQSSNSSRNAWFADDGTINWLFIASFIWVMLTSIICVILFCTNRKVKKNRSSLLSLNLLVSILVNEIILSVTFIYHDAVGNPSSFTFGVHYCRFSILSWSFSYTLQSFSVLLVTIDACFQTFSSPRYNQLLSSQKVFWIIICAPVTLSFIATLVLILPVNPAVGRIVKIGQTKFCFLTLSLGNFRPWLASYSLITTVIPSALSLSISCVLLVRMCRHLSAYGAFGNDSLTSSTRDGASRMKQIVIATFIMNVLFVALSGPYAWIKVLFKFSMFRASKIAFRVYWCTTPLVWLALQPELLVVVTSTWWRCWQRGARETVSMCWDAMRGVEGNSGSDIREYNVQEKPADNFEQVPI